MIAPSASTVPLGGSGMQISRLALGSWRTYERISRDQGVSVMLAARDAGINFLDDARYNDETRRAPMATGYSEVVFGELFRTAGWRREDTIVSNKLWWEFWPNESPSRELAGSLARMGFDYVDLIYSEVPPDSVGLEDAIDMISGLIRTGVARAWGTLNWTPELMERACQIADREGVPGPVATQPPYNLIRREVVDDPPMQRLAAARNIAIVASYPLAGGVLTGKYDQDPAAGRASGMLENPRVAPAVAAGRDLAALARDMGKDPASLAIAFVLLNKSVTTVLFGATRPEQVRANLAALAVADELTPEQRRRLADIGELSSEVSKPLEKGQQGG
jgi:aryl-alcohol dehydrogenase-like predicted oxidoreductase